MTELNGARDWIFRDSALPLPLLKVTQLHHIAAAQARWTDETWDQAVTYLKAKLSAGQMLAISGFTADAGVFKPEDTRGLRGALFKGDQLGVFRHYPPTVLVAFFDLARVHRLIP